MKKLSAFISILFVSFFTVSCFFSRPVSTSVPQNNSSYTIDFLFEHDGCKVYRFHDFGRYVYFTNCSGETISGISDSTYIVNKIKVNR